LEEPIIMVLVRVSYLIVHQMAYGGFLDPSDHPKPERREGSSPSLLMGLKPGIDDLDAVRALTTFEASPPVVRRAHPAG
jgi:hypothetical protein